VGVVVVESSSLHRLPGGGIILPGVVCETQLIGPVGVDDEDFVVVVVVGGVAHVDDAITAKILCEWKRKANSLKGVNVTAKRLAGVARTYARKSGVEANPHIRKS
jgi:hypothetical protein